jgi:hypothetical protein
MLFLVIVRVPVRFGVKHHAAEFDGRFAECGEDSFEFSLRVDDLQVISGFSCGHIRGEVLEPRSISERVEIPMTLVDEILEEEIGQVDLTG